MNGRAESSLAHTVVGCAEHEDVAFAIQHQEIALGSMELILCSRGCAPAGPLCRNSSAELELPAPLLHKLRQRNELDSQLYEYALALAAAAGATAAS